MKRLVALLCAFVMMFSLCACGKIDCGESNSLDGITAEIQSVSTETRKNGNTVFDILVKITNNSDVPVMKVRYAICIRDKDDNELHTINNSYINVESAIKPGECAYDESGFQIKLDGTPKKLSITVEKLYDENDIPPVKLPQKGDFLYKALNNDCLANIDTVLPDSVFIRIDQGGYERVADLQNKEDIQKAVDIFTQIKVGNETQEWVSDNYNAVVFYFADGTSCSVSLNLKNLEVNYQNQYHIYELEDFDAFWSYAQSVVREES